MPLTTLRTLTKKREKTDSLTQIYKYTRWRNDLLPLLDLKNSIFCASPEKYKTIILHRCLLLLCNSYSLFFSIVPSNSLSLSLSLCGAERHSLPLLARYICIFVLFFLLPIHTHFSTRSSDFALASSVCHRVENTLTPCL